MTPQPPPTSVHIASTMDGGDPGAEGGLPVYLHPGQIVVAARDCRLTTILGSCVSVALYDPTCAVGGINHYLLPRGPRDSASARFGEVALPRLLREVKAAGATAASLVAKVFGGACLLGAAGRRDIGSQNVETALAFLARERIRVVAQHTGGAQGRKLIFRTSDGVVWLKSL
jgi:chemotaxis protein CheD